MEMEWRDIVTDPVELKIFEALADPKWDFRTLAALSRASGLPPDKVRAVLANYPRLVRRSPVPDAKDQELYTLVSKGSTLQEWLSTTRAYVSKMAR